MTGASLSETDPLNALAEDFLTRYRRGEQPDMGEYLIRYPDLAEGIRELFPALLLVEGFGAPTPEAPPPTRPMSLRQLGEFRLVREVGRGGMGIVYEAVQQSLGRRVAVKVLAPNLRQGKYLERFQREAKSAARLHHTNIVPVFGVGEHDGQPYYVMQFIDGRGLDALLAEMKASRPSPALPTGIAADSSALPTVSFALDAETSAPTGEFHSSPLSGQPEAVYFRRVAQWSVQAAEALAYAHAQGVLHRDIKPANLLLDTQGRLWIADFGLAKADDSDNLTEQGAVVGTLRYLAPERFQGQCDARADIYALGVTLYEMLTLQPAFVAVDQASLLKQIACRRLTPPRQLVAAIPIDLETIVLKAMAHEPADRYATAEALAEDLRRFLADRPILARRSSVVERLRRWRRRNPLVAWLTSTIVLLTLLLAIGSMLASMWLLHALSESESSQRDLRDHLWRSLIEQARANRRSQSIGHRLESLRILKEAARMRMTAEVRNEVIACVALIDSEEADHWPRPHDPEALYFTFDFPHQRYARINRKNEISIRQLADDAEILHLDSVGELFPWGAGFSPDGRYLVQYAQPDGRHLIWDVSGLKPKLVFQDVIGRPRYHYLSFRGDGQQLAVLHEDGSVLNYDLAAGRRLRRLPPGSASGSLAFHPRRPWLAIIDGASLRVINVEDGKELARLASPCRFEHAAWHPDGVRLAVSAINHTIYLWDVLAPRLLLTFEGHKAFGIHPSFHPSGRVLHSNDWDNRDRWWDIDSGRQLLSAHGGRSGWLTEEPFLQPEYLKTQQRFHRLVEQRVLRTLAYQSGSYRQRFESACLDPAGRWLAVYTPAAVVLFDLARLAALSAVLPGEGWPVAFDPSGALLRSSRTELARCPIAADGEGKVRLGPLETLYRIPRGEGWSCTADGRLAAAGCYNEGARLFHRDRPEAPLRLRPQGDVRRTAVSPDGRWVATSTHYEIVLEAGVKVWDADSGRLVKDLPLKTSHQLAFSRDSRWLGVHDWERCRLWRTGSWEEVPAIEGKSFAFGPDGVMALANGESIRLLDVDSREEFARLEAPQESAPMPQCFSADGTRLVAIGMESDSLMIWDLRTLREELAARGLDWDRPPYPSAQMRRGKVVPPQSAKP